MNFYSKVFRNVTARNFFRIEMLLQGIFLELSSQFEGGVVVILGGRGLVLCTIFLKVLS